ncbi:hypothetical protein CVT25_005114 [Psilocybe cyanescens]|uniref:Uncharacterized protein n=1 Tax=Psilocybe cyanescens TaxID=93625 RepID=A0A409XE48_PSICY|nr:hypothetical protein CVT25_005114 [Psilocybe cyanescens]
MTTLRVMWIFASVAFASALLAPRQTLSSSVQAEYDVICQTTAGENGIVDPLNWVWSDDDQYCVPDALDSDAPELYPELKALHQELQAHLAFARTKLLKLAQRACRLACKIVASTILVATKTGNRAPGLAAVHRAASVAVLLGVAAGKGTVGPGAAPVSPWLRGQSGVTLRKLIARVINTSPAVLIRNATRPGSVEGRVQPFERNGMQYVRRGDIGEGWFLL